MTRHTFSRMFALLGLSALVSAPALAADKTLYTLQSTPIFGTAKGKILGQLLPGTPLTVKGKAGSKLQVELEGWTEEYRELEIFAKKEVRIERASLVRIDKKNYKTLGTETGRFEVVWTKVKLTGWVDKRKLVADLDKVWAPAREIHQERCTECHDFMPASEQTAQMWSGTLRIMTHRAALTPEESVLLKQYLQAGARERGD